MIIRIVALLILLLINTSSEIYATGFVFSGTQGLSPASDSDCINDPTQPEPKPSLVCSNSSSINETTCAGENPCVKGGDLWSKYNLLGCYVDNSGSRPRYYWVYNFDEKICSTGDKCVAGETSLRPGFCSCNYGSSPYKYCCTSTGTPEACIQAGSQDTSFPPEGQCPGGYIVDGSRVRSSACTPIATPAPTPDPTPNPLCPGSGVPSSGWGGSCSPGSVQYPACGACGTCSVAACQQYAPNVYCWFNSGACYNDPAVCPNKCGGGQCTTGTTQTICYPNESTRTCNR